MPWLFMANGGLVNVDHVSALEPEMRNTERWVIMAHLADGITVFELAGEHASVEEASNAAKLMARYMDGEGPDEPEAATAS